MTLKRIDLDQAIEKSADETVKVFLVTRISSKTTVQELRMADGFLYLDQSGREEDDSRPTQADLPEDGEEIIPKGKEPETASKDVSGQKSDLVQRVENPRAGRGQGIALSEEQIRKIWALKDGNWNQSMIAAEIGCSKTTVYNVLSRPRPMMDLGAEAEKKCD